METMVVTRGPSWVILAPVMPVLPPDPVAYTVPALITPPPDEDFEDTLVVDDDTLVDDSTTVLSIEEMEEVQWASLRMLYNDPTFGG